MRSSCWSDGLALDEIDVGLAHQLQELAGIGTQALDIAALALGVDGVEGERAFARAREAGHDDKLLARDVEIDALEIVLARAAHADEVVLFDHGVRERGGAGEGPARRRYMGINSADSARTIWEHGGPADAGRHWSRKSPALKVSTQR